MTHQCTIREILTDKSINIPEGMRATAIQWLDTLDNIASCYEELRQIIDGGSESMTHEDAVQEVRTYVEEAGRIYPDKPLQYFNGRCVALGEQRHGYICARSQAEAVRLGRDAFGASFTRGELKKYWSPCWGNPAQEVIGLQLEPGVWIEHRGKFFKFTGNAKPT